MYKIGIIMGGVMPVPAVCGGAIETLITSIVKKYSPEDGFHLTIFSVYHKEAVEVAKRYPEVKFVWTHTNSFLNLLKHSIFLTVRELTGKTIRPLQRHYNEISPVIQNEKFDLLIVEGGDEQAVIDIAKGYHRKQLVFHAHVHFVPKEEVVKGYGHMIGVSEFVVREYKKACKIPVETHVLKNAIDVGKFSKTISEAERRKLRKELGFQEEDFVVLYVGRLLQIKGILELIQSVLSIKDKHIKLLVIGSTNSGKRSYSAFERKVQKLSEENKDRIILNGYVDNAKVYKYASVADVQCVPTLVEEAAPLVVLEAMTEGIPLIVTKSGGVIEYVEKDTALIIERENIVENLKRAICYMKEHPDVRKKMSEKSKIQSRKYNETNYYKYFVEIIYKIIDRNMKNKNEI